ncbi:MAG: enoyl-CoA hydratase/isomerase family protein [Rhodospirillaceae bacterium]|nr:enoyl-CoA hydratase/isomerase family protein [Rhodospirillaceae bacterium]
MVSLPERAGSIAFLPLLANGPSRRKRTMTGTKSDSLVDYAREGAIVTLTLNRPEKLNAFSDELVGALSEALHRFDMDDEAQIAILNGRGRAFSSGADVQQRQLRSREEFLRLGGPQGRGTHSSDLLTKAVNWKPVIAAAHGYVLGLSVGIVLECDLVVAEEGTKFQVTETSRGLGAGKYWALMHYRGGGAFTMEAALTGRFFTAEEAFKANLINRVAPKGKYLDVAQELARDVIKNPPLSVRSTVRMRRWYMDRLSREVMFMTAPERLYLTEDFGEAARAFTEKRKPKPFKGR